MKLFNYIYKYYSVFKIKLKIIFILLDVVICKKNVLRKYIYKNIYLYLIYKV